MLPLLLALACADPSPSPGDGGVDGAGDGGGDSGADGGGNGGGDGGGDGGAGAAGVTAIYDPHGGDFLSTPWPSDARRDAQGRPDVTGYPNAAGVPLIDTYLATVGEERGFGANTPVYLAFDGPLDTALLPEPAASIEEGAALFLVDLDPTSPGYGQRHPVQWRYEAVGTGYEPRDSLAVGPLFGLPLRPETTYGLVVTTAVADPAPAFPDALDSRADLAPLRAWLDATGLPRDEVAVATVYTTGEHLRALRLAREWVAAHDAPDLSQPLSALRAGDLYTVYEGSYAGPLFQEGERPYTTEGGALRFDDPELEDATAVEPVAWESMRLAVATPTDLSDPPAAGWPVAIVLHGTGGDYLSCCDADHSSDHAAVLAAAGIVTLGIDLPLHGSRGGDLASEGITHPFNFFNPDSARSILRQGAIDAMFLAHALATAPPTLTLPDGGALRLDPAHVFVLGHSQGGLSAQLALPFFGGDVDALVSSGGGGGMAVTLLDRTDPFSLEEALAGVLGLEEGDELHELHPIPALVQWLSERTDPLNVGPWAFHEGGLYEGHAPVDFLQFSGVDDPISPYRISEALAAAARTPVLAPAATAATAWPLAGIGEEEGPLRGNRVAFDGGVVTAALVQGAGEDHGYVYDSPAAQAVYQGFLAGAAQGAPVVSW